MEDIKRIGVLTSGGDAPGMNAAVRAVVRTAITRGVEVVAIYRGYSGLIDGDVRPMNVRDVSNVINKGGTILYSDRCPEFKEKEYRAKAIENCRRLGIDGIVCIGGDGTFQGATKLTEEGVPCIGIPATIDNDITSTDNTIGFDTAMNTVIELVDKLRDTCESHARCNVVEVMGRGAGDIALNTAIALGASAVVVPEFPHDDNNICKRIKKAKDKEFREGCLLVMESMERYHARCLEYLRSVGAKAELIAALQKVPFSPAETLYEALVAWNFIYYLDFCDNIGEMDRILHQYHKGEDVTGILRQFYRNVDANDGWSLRMGPEIYPITRQVLLASKGIRRPLIELCVDETVPDEIWNIAVELVKSGNCNPSFYNYPLYQKAMRERFPSIPQCDLDKFTGCGCSETMLSGISRVGSVDAALHLLYLFSGYMRENLVGAESFDDFYQGLMNEILKKAREMYELVDRGYKFKMTEIPHPVRTVLVDDCIDKETDFNAGGARYSWSCVNFPGSINVLESLLAIRELIFEKKEFTAEQFIELLDKEDEKFYLRLRKCPHFGVNDERADSLAADFFDKVFSSADGFKMCYGEGIITSSVQFITYVRKGEFVASTPDGRRAGEPICDSLAPIMGNDKKSVTSTLGSVAKIPLYKALGTPIVNLRLHKDFENELVKPLVEGFFADGGMQLQITCLSKEDMIAAMAEPEKHRDLMVRVGGYTDYFVNLSREAQETIIKRTEYSE